MKIAKIKFNTKKVKDEAKQECGSIQIMVWNGACFSQIVEKVSKLNPEIIIFIQGIRLVVKDKKTGFYRSIVPGDIVEIPDIPVDIEEDEYPSEDPPPPHCDDAEMVEIMQRWGLLPKGAKPSASTES